MEFGCYVPACLSGWIFGGGAGHAYAMDRPVNWQGGRLVSGGVLGVCHQRPLSGSILGNATWPLFEFWHKQKSTLYGLNLKALSACVCLGQVSFLMWSRCCWIMSLLWNCTWLRFDNVNCSPHSALGTEHGWWWMARAWRSSVRMAIKGSN